MSLRGIILMAFVGGLMVLSLRRWFLALCGLLFLTVFTQHPSMPTMMFNIQGLNPWNMTFAVIVVGWLMNRRFDPPRAPAPFHVVVLICGYLLVVIVAGLAAAVDTKSFRGTYAHTFDSRRVIVDCLVNPLKYLLMGIMFFDGATTRNRVKMALFCAVASGLCYSVLMFKSLHFAVFTIDYTAARHATDKLIGLFANDMAKLMAFALWGAVILAFLVDKKWLCMGWLLYTVLAIPAFIALKSRAGFLAVCAIGLVLGLIRWRRILLLFPVVVVVIVAMAPGVADRVLSGVHTQQDKQQDWDEISSGRTRYIWPTALKHIAESPIIGHGRYGILRTRCYDDIFVIAHGVPQHPHNSYLEILLDAGVIGLGICLTCMGGLLYSSASMLRRSRDPIIIAAAAISLAAVVSELAAGVAGSSFYATQSTVPCLCAWGVAMRIKFEADARKRTASVRRPRPMAVVQRRPMAVSLEQP